MMELKLLLRQPDHLKVLIDVIMIFLYMIVADGVLIYARMVVIIFMFFLHYLTILH